MILNLIKNKISRNERLTSEDIDIVHILPLMCDKKDRNYFRVESLKIINMITWIIYSILIWFSPPVSADPVQMP